MIKSASEIVQKQSTLTESELQVAVACKWLRLGIPSMGGGEKLAKYLEDNRDNIENIFGADDRVYIKGKNPLINVKLVQFIIENEIGDEVEWIKGKDADRWWLMVWWD